MPRGNVKSPLPLRSEDPLYKQIARNILQCLAQGEWKPGAQLPTESELAERFGVAIYTVRAGIGELVAAGILARIQGKGTFAARHERDRERQLFSRVFDNENRKVIPTKEVVRFFCKERADERVMDQLCLDRRQEHVVYRWEVILHLNGRAVSIRQVTVPARLFPGMTSRVLRDNTQNTYSLYQEVCGVNVTRMEERVRALKADAEQAAILGVKRGAPLLQIDRKAFTYNDVPVELRTRIYEGTNFHYCAIKF